MSYREHLAALPFHFWSGVFFALGATVGSFLNVCIHRLPRGESIVSPPSHCPACGGRIPWRHNLPILSWLWLRGRCAMCGAPIAARYLLVELLTATLFLGCWIVFGRQSPALALVYAAFLAALLAATFIDMEHYIIPDEITLGGAIAGFLCSFFVPALHGAGGPIEGARAALIGAALGGAVMYGILRLGKWLFGKERLQLEPGSVVFFGEDGIELPTRFVPYEEVFYRPGDEVRLQAERVELADRCYGRCTVRLSRDRLQIGQELFDPEQVPFMEVVTDRLQLPREAMGLGDVKFMTAIGAFLGWQGVLFTLMASAMVGAAFGVAAIAVGRREWSSRIPYGPYLALAATVWVFAGDAILHFWLGR